MACKIVWPPKALHSYFESDFYLQHNWPEKVRLYFNDLLKRKIELLKQFPKLGRKSNQKYI